MNWFKNIFNGKSLDSTVNNNVAVSSTPKRGYISAGGLYPDELAMLSLAERFTTNEVRYPEYLRTKFFIGFPANTLDSLFSRGFLRVSTPFESLPFLKLAELKAIASMHSLKVTGTKDELCSRISSSLNEMEIAPEVKLHYWRLTDKGHNELAENPYITYMTAEHTYYLENFGINIITLNSSIHNVQNYRIRDVVWGKLNETKLMIYKEALRQKNFDHYAELIRTISLFLAEESKYSLALNTYIEYIFYKENFVAGANAIILVSSKSNFSIDLYAYGMLMPYEINELSELLQKNGLNEEMMCDLMRKVFKNQNDQGVFSDKQLIEFVVAEMNGRRQEAQSICVEVEKNIKKKIR